MGQRTVVTTPAVIPPSVTVHPLSVEHSHALVRLLEELWNEQPYSAPLDDARVQADIFADPPPSIYSVRWQQQRLLGAWRAGQLIGFVHVAAGFDSDSLDRPDYSPLGLLRFMHLPSHGPLAATTGTALLAATQQFWQEMGVAEVKAFHPSIGYPSFQAGAGTLPAEWSNVVAALTGDDYFLSERHYMFARRLTEPIEEVVPLADLSLVYRGDWLARDYELYYRRVDRVAWANVARMSLAGDEGEFPLCKVVNMFVHPQWRRQDLAKWLLRRIINDATHLGDAQMVVHLGQHHHAAMNLLIQQGFQELSYRGYTLEKVLTQ